MMREEFVNLTKVEVTSNYYENKIEPLYVERDIDKRDFCEQWLKENKAHLCKAHSFDISNASMEIALRNAKISGLEKKLEEQNDYKNENEKLQVELRNCKSNNESLEELLPEMEAAIVNLKNENASLASAQEQLVARDNEIIRLKAMLFDLMTSKAA